jgi:hypothetical protein
VAELGSEVCEVACDGADDLLFHRSKFLYFEKSCFLTSFRYGQFSNCSLEMGNFFIVLYIWTIFLFIYWLVKIVNQSNFLHLISKVNHNFDI